MNVQGKKSFFGGAFPFSSFLPDFNGFRSRVCRHHSDVMCTMALVLLLHKKLRSVNMRTIFPFTSIHVHFMRDDSPKRKGLGCGNCVYHSSSFPAKSPVRQKDAYDFFQGSSDKLCTCRKVMTHKASVASVQLKKGFFTSFSRGSWTCYTQIRTHNLAELIPARN